MSSALCGNAEPKLVPADQAVGVSRVKPEVSPPGPVPYIFSQRQLEILLLFLFQAFLLLKSYHILPLMWLHSCGKWSDSRFRNDSGSFGKGTA